MSNEIDKFINRNIDKVIQWTRFIEDMLDEPDLYGYADDFLRDVLGHIEQVGDVTDRQMKAIENIHNKPSKRYGRRRY